MHRMDAADDSRQDGGDFTFWGRFEEPFPDETDPEGMDAGKNN